VLVRADLAVLRTITEHSLEQHLVATVLLLVLHQLAAVQVETEILLVKRMESPAVLVVAVFRLEPVPLVLRIRGMREEMAAVHISVAVEVVHLLLVQITLVRLQAMVEMELHQASLVLL
jgi:hypothetical protein